MSATTSVEVGRIVPPATPVFRDPARVGELTDSIRVVLRCPLVVRPLNDRVFELVDGCLRLEAVDALGWREVPAVVLDLDDRAAARMRLVLNAARRSISPLEEARLVRYLVDRGDNRGAIAAVLGRSSAWVQARLELHERLCAALHFKAERGELSPLLASEIATAPAALQEPLHRAAHTHSLSPHATGRLARYLAEPGRTTEERLDALADPGAVLGRPGRRPPSRTPVRSHRRRHVEGPRPGADARARPRRHDRARPRGVPRCDRAARASPRRPHAGAGGLQA